MVSCLASAAGRSDSTAASTSGCSAVGRIDSSIVPATMRERSSRSSMSRDCAQPARSIAWTARAVWAASSLPLASSRAQPSTELSGVRNSCDSVVRNSSLSRLAAFGLPRLFVGGAQQRGVVVGRPRRCRGAAGATPARRCTTATAAIADGQQNRPDVFDFPHQYGRQYTNGGKRRHDETPELVRSNARTRVKNVQLSARTRRSSTKSLRLAQLLKQNRRYGRDGRARRRAGGSCTAPRPRRARSSRCSRASASRPTSW